MADVKDTVASHISTNWTGTVVGGSGSTPTIDAVGPEDITKPEDYPEAILVYNETTSWDRTFAQNQYGDRHTRVYILVTAHRKSGCTKTHFRAFIDELKAVFGSAISGYDVQLLDEPENVTRTRGVGPGMYQASFVLHLWEYGVSTSSAAAGGAAGTTIWTEPFITYQASANLSAERVLTLTADNTLGANLLPDSDSARDLGSTTKYWKRIYVDDLYVSNDLNIVGDVTEVDEIKSAGTIELKPSGETDDYLSFSTVSGIPQIQVIGGTTLKILSDDSTWAMLTLEDDSSHYTALQYHKTDHYLRIRNKGAVWWYIEDTTHMSPSTDKTIDLGVTGTNRWDDVYADDFTNESHVELIEEPVEQLKQLKFKSKPKKDETESSMTFDYSTLPDWVRQTEKKDKDNKVTKTTIDGVKINRVQVWILQALQDIITRLEALEAAQPAGSGK